MRTGGVNQVVENLPSKCKALSSNPSTARERKIGGGRIKFILNK
jgi:hypothetical protein